MSNKQLRCANCGDNIYSDQERIAVKASHGKSISVFHKDHTGCVDSLRRRQDNKKPIKEASK